MRFKIDIPSLKSLLTLAAIMEARDAYMGGHVWRVGQYASFIAGKLGLGVDLELVARIGGLAHDIGKVGIPDAIVNKHGKFTPREYAIIKQHPAIGGTIIAYHPMRPIIWSSVVEHHEWMNGKGYPRGIPDSELSIIGKVVSVADVFDAMTSPRAYHKAHLIPAAISTLEAGKNSQFDPKVVDALVALQRNGELSGIIGHSADEVKMASCPGCGPIVARPRYAQDGDDIVCPLCKKVFRLHRKDETFVLEWAGRTIDACPVPESMQVVEDLLRILKPEIVI